jgi:conjugal transfer pilus assembly protein TraE
MKHDYLAQNLQSLRFQRNIFAALSCLVSISLIILSIFLFTTNERIIVTPPMIEKEFWVEGKHISPTYLEQYGCFLGQLLLGKSSQSAPMQRTVLLRNTAPNFVGVLKNKLIEEEETLKKQNAAYVFYPVEVKVDPKNKEVLLIGDRIFFVSGQKVSQEREEYLLSFTYSGSRLLLSGVSSQEKGAKNE